MNHPQDFTEALERVRNLHANGRVGEAERACRQLAAAGEKGGAHREAALRMLAEIYVQARQPEAAIAALVALTEEVPDSLRYYVHLAKVLETIGRADLAIGHYRRLLKSRPGMAAAHFNVALLYKKEKRYAEALAAYEEAARLGIENVHEVFSNIGVLYSEMRRPERAEEMLQRALDADPNYLPALFNLAGLFEEAGKRAEAVALYERILAADAGHAGALARLAYAERVTDDTRIRRLQAAIEAAGDDPLAREELSFALGKSYDDLGRYEEAFTMYRAANELGRLRNPAYDRAATEAAFDRLIELFSADWIDRASTASREAPVFICGMFRSGSTLVEQILSAHPCVKAGGELDYLPWLIARRLSPYPEAVRKASCEQLGQIGSEYLAKLRELFPREATVTDKRPDNFLHLGLIKALFPAARIVYTRREPLDNCLSVYFQQLGGNLGYATDIENTAHYYRRHECLMNHWKACFAENIFTVDYDALVRSPEPQVRQLLEFLGLEWNDAVLDFHQASTMVKTASVWQVRERLHRHSSGRWRNYEAFMSNIDRVRALLGNDAA